MVSFEMHIDGMDNEECIYEIEKTTKFLLLKAEEFYGKSDKDFVKIEIEFHDREIHCYRIGKKFLAKINYDDNTKIFKIQLPKINENNRLEIIGLLAHEVCHILSPTLGTVKKDWVVFQKVCCCKHLKNNNL